VNSKAQNSTSSDLPVGVYNRTHCGTNQGYRLADNELTNVIYTCEGDPQLSESGAALYDAARVELQAAQREYDALLTSQAAEEVLAARAAVAVEQERYYTALDLLHDLQTADQSPAVSAARSAMEQAQAAADQSTAAVVQARANHALLGTQLSKLKLYAPIGGVILTRAVEPGEFLQPGAVAMTMADLGSLTITVYVPEDRYGAISVGQRADVTVDSFPGETFGALVIRIADQAEFTPRNVQTVEGRSSTLYAVTLSVPDTQGRLKIGMPADVLFVP
jgi:HlyD family secretion protein